MTLPFALVVILSILAIPGAMLSLFGLWVGIRLISIYWRDRRL